MSRIPVPSHSNKHRDSAGARALSPIPFPERAASPLPPARPSALPTSPMSSLSGSVAETRKKQSKRDEVSSFSPSLSSTRVCWRDRARVKYINTIGRDMACRNADVSCHHRKLFPKTALRTHHIHVFYFTFFLTVYHNAHCYLSHVESSATSRRRWWWSRVPLTAVGVVERQQPTTPAARHHCSESLV